MVDRWNSYNRGKINIKQFPKQGRITMNTNGRTTTSIRANGDSE